MADLQVVTAIESFLLDFTAQGAAPVAVQVRASGDDVDVIKVWIDLGAGTVAVSEWATACEQAITKAVPEAAGFRIQVRVEQL